MKRKMRQHSDSRRGSGVKSVVGYVGPTNVLQIVAFYLEKNYKYRHKQTCNATMFIYQVRKIHRHLWALFWESWPGKVKRDFRSGATRRELSLHPISYELRNRSVYMVLP